MARRSARQRKARKDLWGWALISGCVALALAVGVWYWRQTTNVVALDAHFCPLTGPQSVTAILVDRTDTMTPIQQRDIRIRFNAVRDDVPRYGMLAVYSITASTDTFFTPEYRMCNPGRGDNMSPLISNPERAKMRWEAMFDAPLQELFDRMIEGGEEEASPIFEAIQAVALDAFSQEGLTREGRQLIIVSDLLHHTKDVSHYQGVPDFPSFARQPYYRKIRTDLHGAEVTVYYVRRETARNIPVPKLIEFWKDYFLDQNATPSFIQIQG